MANLFTVYSVNDKLDAKESVRAATIASITLSGTQTIDAVSLVVGDRVLVKDQGAATNGIYNVQSGAWRRALDLPVGAIAAGMLVFVEEGTINGDKGFLCTSNQSASTVDTHTLDFSTFSGSSFTEFLLSGIASTDSLGYTVIGGIQFNPAVYGATSVRFEALLETTNASDSAILRIWNVTDSVVVKADPLVTSTSLTPELLNSALTTGTHLPSSSKTYELQMKMGAGSSPDRVTCKMAKFVVGV